MGLKQEMREMFEKRNAMAFNERNSRLEEGLLEKIVNLAFANLCRYSGKLWEISVIKTPVLLQKLYRLTNDKRIPESSAVLLVADPGPGARSGGTEEDIGLLSLSFEYAAKYYCIESFVTRDINSDAVIREFSLAKSSPVIAAAGFGVYREISAPGRLHARYVYSDIVKEL